MLESGICWTLKDVTCTNPCHEKGSCPSGNGCFPVRMNHYEVLARTEMGDLDTSDFPFRNERSVEVAEFIYKETLHKS